MSRKPSRQEIESLILKGSGWPDTKSDWYHRMDLGEGLVTSGQASEGLLPVAALAKSVHLDALQCLDVGTMDGKMAFLMEKRGAGRVAAVDVFKRDTIASLIPLYGSKVEYQHGVRAEELPKLRESFGRFDFVLCAGVLYHVYSPLDVILTVRGLLKNGGMVIFESACLADKKNATLTLNHGDIYDDHTTIWVPSIACMRWMMSYACFKIVAEATLSGSANGIPRHAVLAEAVTPESMDADGWMKTFNSGKASWGFGYEYLKPQLDLKDWAAAEKTKVTCDAIKNHHIEMNFGRKKSYGEEEKFLEMGTPAELNSGS